MLLRINSLHLESTETRWRTPEEIAENAIRKVQEWTTQRVYVSQSTINERIRAVEWYRFTPEELKLYLETLQEALAKAKNGSGTLTPEEELLLEESKKEAYSKATNFR